MCSQPMLQQIAGRFSQCSDSMLNTQSVHQFPALMLLFVNLPRIILLIELVSHVMCQSFQLVCVPPHKGMLLSIQYARIQNLLALIS